MVQTSPEINEIATVTPDELLKVLTKMYAQKNPKPFIKGTPGLGKTSVCYQLAEKLGIPRFTFQATLYDPTEIKGLPIFDHDKNIARFLPFEDMPSMDEGLLIIDDLPHAPTQTQNAFMRLVLEGQAGAWNIGGLFPIATGNRALDRAGAKDLQTAIADRFCHLNLVADNQSWRKWAIGADIHPSVVAYLGTPLGKEWLNHFDPSQQISATPRSWEMVSHILKAFDGEPTSGLVRTAMMGCVGQEATLKFTGWMKYYDKMPDLQKIVAGKNIYPEEMDVMYATISGLVALAKDFPKKESIVQRLIDYSVKMPKNFIELGALLNKDLIELIGQDAFVDANLEEWVEIYPDLISGR